jgi:hypothetical protein
MRTSIKSYKENKNKMEQSEKKRGTKWKNVNSITVKFIKEKIFSI